MPCGNVISTPGFLLQLFVIAALGFTTSNVTFGQEKQTPGDTQPLIVDFGDGHTLEFVGITKNTAKAEEGWRADGKTLKNPGYWKSTTVLHSKHTTSSYTENGGHPEPDEGAVDFLFRWKGLKGQPSITFDLPTSGSGYSHDSVKDPHELRVSGRLREPAPPGLGYSTPDDVATIGFTDEPWGRWVKISPEGKVLDPIQADERYASTYGLIDVLGTALPTDRVPGINQISIRQPNGDKDPSDEWHRFSFEFRGVDTDGKEHWAMMLTGRGDGGAFQTCEYGLSRLMPEGKTFSHYEYRVRPYKYWATFDRVSLSAGVVTEPGLTGRTWP